MRSNPSESMDEYRRRFLPAKSTWVDDPPLDLEWWHGAMAIPKASLEAIDKDELHRKLSDLLTANVNRLIEECRNDPS